jgi:predicted lipid-binding transport protein (Tim44 family)
MKKLLVLSMLTLFALTVVGVEYADAKRFGMGSSFGKQRLFKQPAQQRTPAQQKAAPTRTQRGAAGTGMMGMLGGLALGGLLGAMFFGGAFEGINLFDIVIFSILGFILLRMLTANARRAHATAYNSQPQQGLDTFGSSNAAPVQGQAVTPDIDPEFFLGAAKDIFVRMQAAWDKKDMQEIRGFCTPEVAQRIEVDLQGIAEKTTQTEVATLHAEIMDMWVESNLEWVAVYFTAMIKEQEDGVEIATHEVQEHWIFQHDPKGEDPTWYLAGIQQS